MNTGNAAPILIKDLGPIFPLPSSKHKRGCGVYRCFCGKEFTTMHTSVKNGKSKTCGCSRTVHSMSNHPLYHTWKNMINRTSNANNDSYDSYGARGIDMCAEWKNDIHVFIADMYPSYVDGYTVDRIDNNLGYSKDNCRWASRTEQQSNTRIIQKNNTSGYRGVVKKRNKFVAHISVCGKNIALGTYESAAEAASARNSYIIENNLPHILNVMP